MEKKNSIVSALISLVKKVLGVILFDRLNMDIHAASQEVKLIWVETLWSYILRLPYPVTQIFFTLPLPQEECSLHAC